MRSVEQRLVRLRNELRAQKTAGELAYSSLLWPENTPSATYSGTIDFSKAAVNGVLARVRFRFKRGDGKMDAPFVDFPFTFSFTPSYVEYEKTQGVTVSGNDVDYVDEQAIVGYKTGVGNGYADFCVDVSNLVVYNFGTLSSLKFSVTVEAISSVKGTLTYERLI